MASPESPERGAAPEMDPVRLDELAAACRRVTDAWGGYTQWRLDRAPFRQGFGEREFVVIDLWMSGRVSEALGHLLRQLGMTERDILVWFGNDLDDDDDDAAG